LLDDPLKYFYMDGNLIESGFLEWVFFVLKNEVKEIWAWLKMHIKPWNLFSEKNFVGMRIFKKILAGHKYNSL
jgi:hypothetical protein